MKKKDQTVVKVSVILPNYNHARFLEQRIQSIVDQTFQEFELIILDDCSTDDSRGIIESYRDNPKVSQIIYNEQNSGSTFKQWIKGINAAKGEYIWLAESDDWAENDFLDIMAEQLDNHKEVSLVFCKSHIVDINGNMVIEEAKSNGVKIYDGIQFLENRLLLENVIINASMVLFRRSSFLKCDVVKISLMKFAGDWLLWSSLCEQGSVIEIENPLNFYRKHITSVSPKAIKNGSYAIETHLVFQHNKKYVTGRRKKQACLRHIAKNRWSSFAYCFNTHLRLFGYFIKNEPLIIFYFFVYKILKTFNIRK